MNVEAAVRYPIQGDDAAKNLLIGGGLLLLGAVISLVAGVLSILFIGIFLFPFALIPQVLVQGYLVRVLRSTIDGEAEPPTFDEWGDIGVDGLRFVVVAIVYSLPATVAAVFLTAALVGTFTLGIGVNPDQAGATGIVLLIVAAVGGLLVLLLFFLLAYLLPAGLCAVAQEGEVSAAFDLDRLRRVGRDRDYAVAWGIGVAVILVGNTVGQMLAVLLVGFPILFAAQVAGFRLFAVGYRDALDLDGDAASPSADSGGAPATPSAGGGTPTPASGDTDGSPESPSSASDGTRTDG